jgi:protein phosphatase
MDEKTQETQAVVVRNIKLVAACGTDIGQNRKHNEDSVLVRADIALFVLADGAGGHNAGNVASALATSCVAKAFEASARAFPEGPDVEQIGPALARRLAAAIQRANKEIVEIAKSSHRYHGMGTTVVAIVFSPDGQLVHIAHVGDSRCYRLRGAILEALTQDHSLMNDVLELRPDIDDGAILKLPKNVVTRALGMEESLRVSVRTLRVVPGDRYLLCSDGLWDPLDDESMGVILGRAITPDEMVRAFIDNALLVGADDNIGVVVVACEPAEGSQAQPPRRFGRKSRPAVSEMRPMFGSAPEIVIVGVEEHATDAPIVVPADSASESLLDAFAGLRKKKPPASGT